MSLMTTIALLILGLAGSAFFSSTETALTSLPVSRVESLMKTGGAMRRWAWRRWRELPHRVLVTLLVGNTFINVGLSALVTEATIRFVGDHLVGVSAGLTTLAVLVFGEVTPKTLARVDAEAVSNRVIVLTAALDWLLTPLVVPLLGLSHLASHLRRVPLDEAQTASSPEDLRFMFSLARQEGQLSAQQEQMLRAVLRFESAHVREVQVPRTDAVFLRHSMSLDDVRQTVVRTGYSRYPVVQGRDDNVVGILMAKDLLRLGSDEKPWTSLLKPAHFVPETMRVVDLLRDLRDSHTHIAVSIDEYGNLAGVVALEDLIELIVGDIRDEHDTAEPMWRRDGDGSFVVRGSIPLARLALLTEREIESDTDYTSVAGLLLARAGHVPQAGETFTVNDLVLTVTRASDRRIEQVRVTPRVTEPR
jgi:putative hemolysin